MNSYFTVVEQAHLIKGQGSINEAVIMQAFDTSPFLSALHATRARLKSLVSADLTEAVWPSISPVRH
jgi:hypothetical protein